MDARDTGGPPGPEEQPTFHEFATEWLRSRESEGLKPRTLEDYEWGLSHHLLPFFADHELRSISIREVDRYKNAKAREGALSANSINKTLTLLSMILSVAVEYELIGSNPATGHRRRLKRTKPNRPYVEPEQLPALLDAAGTMEGGYGRVARPIVAVLAGAGLRIGEALALRWRDVSLSTRTIRVMDSKTEAGCGRSISPRQWPKNWRCSGRSLARRGRKIPCSPPRAGPSWIGTGSASGSSSLPSGPQPRAGPSRHRGDRLRDAPRSEAHLRQPQVPPRR